MAYKAHMVAGPLVSNSFDMFISGTYRIELKSDVKMALTTTEDDEKVVKNNEQQLIDVEFSQSFQIRNKGESPIKKVSVQVDIPSHYAQREMVQFMNAMISKGDGSIVKCNQNYQERIDAIGRASTSLPERIDCGSTAGVRCFEIR